MDKTISLQMDFSDLDPKVDAAEIFRLAKVRLSPEKYQSAKIGGQTQAAWASRLLGMMKSDLDSDTSISLKECYYCRTKNIIKNDKGNHWKCLSCGMDQNKEIIPKCIVCDSELELIRHIGETGTLCFCRKCKTHSKTHWKSSYITNEELERRGFDI